MGFPRQEYWEILERVAILFSRGTSWPRDWTQVSCNSGRFFTTWATREASKYVVVPLSLVWYFATPHISASQASLSFTVSWSLLKLMSIESVMASNHFILCCPLFSSCLQSFPASSGSQSTRVSASASVLAKNIQGWFPLRLPDWISLLSKRLSSLESSPAPLWKHQLFSAVSLPIELYPHHLILLTKIFIFLSPPLANHLSPTSPSLSTPHTSYTQNCQVFKFIKWVKYALLFPGLCSSYPLFWTASTLPSSIPWSPLPR